MAKFARVTHRCAYYTVCRWAGRSGLFLGQSVHLILSASGWNLVDWCGISCAKWPRPYHRSTALFGLLEDCWTQTWTRYFVAKLMCTRSDMYMKRWNQSRDDVYWKTHYLESKLHELYSECPCVGSWHILDIFFSLETLPHGKCCYSAPKIAREINDGDSESWEHGLQERASFVVAAYYRYVY